MCQKYIYSDAGTIFMENCKDLQVLSLLRQDARRPLTEMSRKTGIPVSTLFAKLKEYRESYVNKFTCVLNYDKLGYSVTANILFKIDKNERDTFNHELARSANINSFCRINNGFDFMAEGIFENLHAVERFLERLEGKHKIRKTQVYYVIEKMKEEGFLTSMLAHCDESCSKGCSIP